MSGKMFNFHIKKFRLKVKQGDENFSKARKLAQKNKNCNPLSEKKII